MQTKNETRLREARNGKYGKHDGIWDARPEVAAHFERRLERCKLVLAPEWKRRADQIRHEASERKLYTWA